MAYKIRAILDVAEDVFRDIIVNETSTLEDLHFTIAKSFGFKGQEMASFYLTDDEWEQGEEIPLFDMSEDGGALTMSKFTIEQVLKLEGDKLIYVYDFFSMWTFYVEVTDVASESKEELPFIALSFGEAPDEAPEKEFTAEDDIENLDAFDSEEGFESLDDLEDF